MSNQKARITISIYTGLGAVLGGEIFKLLLNPRNQYACTHKLLDSSSALDQLTKTQHFNDPCLNALGLMASGFDPIVLFVIGALALGALGFLIGRYKSRSLA
ncbi:MAG: hypothetical protein ABI986_02510 [Chloroflexota bacterium]